MEIATCQIDEVAFRPLGTGAAVFAALEEVRPMKTYVIFSSREPLLIVTRRSIQNREVLGQMGRIGCTKFIAREVPAEQVRRQYPGQFEVIERALAKGDSFRVLDYSGERVFRKLPFSEFGLAYRYEFTPPRTQPPYRRHPIPQERGATPAASLESK